MGLGKEGSRVDGGAIWTIKRLIENGEAERG